MRVLVTGANGFIGRALCIYMQDQGYKVVAGVRRPCGMENEYVMCDDDASIKRVLSGCDVVVHLAGRAHVMREEGMEPLSVFRLANVDASARLASIAAQAGVRRFVFMSSVKVNGEYTNCNSPFSPSDTPAPKDAYSISKWEAEQALQSIVDKSRMELVVIRPPLVYGPGVKGNFSTLIKCVKRGIPLPLGAIDNKRSMLALENLLEFTTLCANFIESPKAAGQVFLVSDDDDVSITELLHRVARAYVCKARLFSVPAWFLNDIASFLGFSEATDRLLGSLILDNSKAFELLGWQPAVTMDDQLKRMANVASY